MPCLDDVLFQAKLFHPKRFFAAVASPAVADVVITIYNVGRYCEIPKTFPEEVSNIRETQTGKILSRTVNEVDQDKQQSSA